MARVLIEIDNGCDACWKKDKTSREGVTLLTLCGKSWYLCEEHERKFADQFTEIMGDPNKEGESE